MTHALRPRSAGFLAHPLWWAALATLVFNDLYLKGTGAFPALSGKLSDFAGMLVAPALLAALCRATSGRALAAGHAAVGLGFALLKLWPAFARAWEALGQWLGLEYRVCCDPTDLWALPLLACSYALCRRSDREGARQAWSGAARKLALTVGLAACLGTSRPPPSAPAPRLDSVLVYDDVADRLYVFERASGRLRAVVESEKEPVVLEQSYVVAEDGVARAIDITTRRERWRRPIADDARLSECHDAVFVSEAGRTRLIAEMTGARRWQVPALLDRAVCVGELVLYNETAAQLIARDRESGAVRWAAKQDAWYQAGQARTLGPHLALLALQELDAVDPATGAVVWSVRAPNYDQILGLDRRGEPSAAVVLSNYRGGVLAIDVSGKRLWERADGRALAMNRSLVLLQEDREHVAVELQSGRELWRKPASSWQPALDEDLVVARDRSDTGKFVVAFSASTGAALWSAGAPDR